MVSGISVVWNLPLKTIRGTPALAGYAERIAWCWNVHITGEVRCLTEIKQTERNK